MSTQTQSFELEVFPRTQKGKNAARKLRNQGLVPAVVYGPNMTEAVSVQINEKDTLQLYKKTGRSNLVTLKANGEDSHGVNGSKVLFSDIQVHPFKTKLIHVDLHKLDPNKSVRVTIPLTFSGKAKGLQEGGIVSIVSREVEIRVKPQDIPAAIDVDLTDLDVNSSVHLSDFAKKTSQYEFIFENDIVLAACNVPEEQEATPEEKAKAAAAAEAGEAAAGAPAADAKK